MPTRKRDISYTLKNYHIGPYIIYMQCSLQFVHCFIILDRKDNMQPLDIPGKPIATILFYRAFLVFYQSLIKQDLVFSVKLQLKESLCQFRKPEAQELCFLTPFIEVHFGSENILILKKFWAQTKFWAYKKFWVWKHFRSEKLFGRKKSVRPKKNFGPKIF